MREKRSAQNWWWRQKSSGYNYIEKKQPKSSSLSNAPYIQCHTQPQPFFNLKILHLAKKDYTTSGCDGCDKYVVWTKMRIFFIDNVSCTKCPKSVHFLRSQITVWLYKVWVCLSRQKASQSLLLLIIRCLRWEYPSISRQTLSKAAQSWSSLITRCPHPAHWLGRC